ncbi:MAG: IS6 family transposase [Francisellaceae bacterium]|nr:IS6 family transposase [Francisellaceae bacterium]MBT6539165.1 IS6 family transposase [Francisellaceae bacterium]
MKSIMWMAVRWYVSYALSYRYIDELLLERCLQIEHSFINFWVIEYYLKLKASIKNKNKPLIGSWRTNESYVKVKGAWIYQCRDVDKERSSIDSCFSENCRK